MLDVTLQLSKSNIFILALKLLNRSEDGSRNKDGALKDKFRGNYEWRIEVLVQMSKTTELLEQVGETINGWDILQWSS